MMEPSRRSVARAITTDVHFWVPVAVLMLGVVLLALIK